MAHRAFRRGGPPPSKLKCQQLQEVFRSSTPSELQAKLTQVVIIGAFVVDDIDAALLHPRQLGARYVGSDARQIGIAGSPDGRWSGPDANAGTEARPGSDRRGGVVGPQSYIGNTVRSSNCRRHDRDQYGFETNGFAVARFERGD